MSRERKLEVHQRGCDVPGCTTHDPERDLMNGLQDAIDAAAEKGETTVLLGHGKPIAAIVPVGHAEWGEAMTALKQATQESGIFGPSSQARDAHNIAVARRGVTPIPGA